MREYVRILFTCIALVSVATAPALAGAEMPEPLDGSQLGTLNKLIGTWTGTEDRHGEEAPVTVDYRLTSGGTAIMETLFEGTPMEMVTVYHQDGDAVMMTHYCALGNQPRMKLEGDVNANELKFSYLDSTGMAPDDAHMHGLVITLHDDGSMEQAWSFYEEGAEQHVSCFKLTRQE